MGALVIKKNSRIFEMKLWKQIMCYNKEFIYVKIALVLAVNLLRNENVAK